MSEFMVVTSQIVGNMAAGFSQEYYPNYERFTTKAAAIKHGFEVRGSDDFNVAELGGDTLLRFWWMDESDQFDSELPEIAAACGWDTL